VLPRVFLVAGHRHTDAARVRAAALWIGASGAVSGPAAAWWHGMRPAPPEMIELTGAARALPTSATGVCLRRRAFTTADLVKLRGLWVTDKALTALETAAATRPGQPAGLRDRGDPGALAAAAAVG
jgi:hypothetical protein